MIGRKKKTQQDRNKQDAKGKGSVSKHVARNSKGRFVKGVSGNPDGRPKKKEVKPRHTVTMPDYSEKELQEAGWFCVFDSNNL